MDMRHVQIRSPNMRILGCYIMRRREYLFCKDCVCVYAFSKIRVNIFDLIFLKKIIQSRVLTIYSILIA